MNFLKKLVSWWRLRKIRKDHYCCSRCGHVFPKKGAQISAWEDHPYGFHVHCPICGAVVAQYVKKPDLGA